MIRIICIGKVKEKFYREAIEEYKTRLSKYTKLEIIELPDYNYSIKENRDKINELVRAVNQIILDNSEED